MGVAREDERVLMAISQDYQIEVVDGADTLLLGPGTDYIIHNLEGLGLPELRTDDAARPSDHGVFPSRDFLADRKVTVTGTARGDSASDVTANLDALMALWQPVYSDAADVVHLAYRLPGQVARLVKGRPRRANIESNRIIGNRASFVLEFTAVDPRIYAATESTDSTTIAAAAGGRQYDRTYNVTYGASAGGFLVLTNDGNFPSRPFATITGPASNPRIENVTTGQTMRLALTVAAGDFVEVDFDARTIMLNGTASRYSSLTAASEWWELAPGNTEVRFRADDTGGELDISWRSAWL